MIVSKHRIHYNDYYYVIVPDIASGRDDRYTVYRLLSSPRVNNNSPGAKIVGRELPLAYAKTYVKRLEKESLAEAKRKEAKIVSRCTKDAIKKTKTKQEYDWWRD